MDAKNPLDKTNEPSLIFPDHNTPMQGEYAMKKEEGEVKNSLMEAVQLEIELEKRKIREEIIASEIIKKRQELEKEVRMELMMEKELMGMKNMRSFYRDDYHSLLMNSSGFLGGSYLNKSLLNVGNSEDLFGKNLNSSIGGAYDGEFMQSNPQLHVNDGVVGNGEMLQMQQDVNLGKRPFERDSSLVAAHVGGKSVAEFGGEVVCDQTMPSSGISGMKRKAETSAIDDETASVASKNIKKKWYCSLCDISATSAGALNLHLHGKKHKAKEAQSKCSDTASNISMDSYSSETLMQTAEQNEAQVQPMEEEKSRMQPTEEENSQIQLLEDKKSDVQPMEEEKSQVAKKWECSLCQIFATSEILLKSHLQGKKHKAKEAKLGLGLGSNEKHADSVKEKGEAVKKWYCSLCQVSAPSEKNLNDHFNGKRHKAKAGLLNQEADDVESNSTKKNSEDVKMVKEKSLEGKEGLKNEQETRDDIIESSKDQVSEQDIINAPDIVTTGSEEDMSNIEGNKHETSSRELVKFWHCKMCNEGTYDEATMANHRKSSKHMDMLRKNGGGLIVVSNKLKEAV